MNSSFKRFLKNFSNKESALLKSVAAEASPNIPPEFNGKDYIAFLLHIDAEIEHGLMLQYLYAAYSLGGPQVPEKYRAQVRKWQEIILGVAKEEMAHFISVQNALKLIGAPLNLGRDDYPWDTPFYPFPFKLEPLTLDSLAKYVYCESPPKGEWGKENLKYEIEIYKKVNSETRHHHRVGELFDLVLKLIKDPKVIPDDAFQPNTFPFQATWDEWGRGYKGGRSSVPGMPEFEPDLLVLPGASRDDAYNALKAISVQGEAGKVSENSGLPSHFERFLNVYKEMQQVQKESGGKWLPARNVGVNPWIDDSIDPHEAPDEGLKSDQRRDKITNPTAQLWANLFNVRYRMVLNYLTHTFLLDGGLTTLGSLNPRGIIINSTFGEMYNMRSIAGIMVQLPISLNPSCKVMAGPPFLIPYTIELPLGEYNRWSTHKDQLIAASRIVDQLLISSPEKHHNYLHSLQEADDKLLKMIDKILLQCK